MKLSNFNIIIPTEVQGEYLLTNMMSGAVVAIDEELKRVLEKGAVDTLDASIAETLTQMEVILPDHIDELRTFKVEYESKKYNGSAPNYTLITTYACNLACPYCYQGKGELFQGTMTKDMRERVITFIQKSMEKTHAETFSVALYGGEPLLDFDGLVSIMEPCSAWAEEHGLTYAAFMLTNGTLVTPSIAETLQKYSTKYVQITLDGPKRIHDTKRVYKNGGGTFDDIMRSAHLLRDHGVGVYFRVNVDAESRPYLGELLNELQTEGLRDVDVYCSMVSASQAGHDYSKCINEGDFRNVLAEFRDIVEKKGQKTTVIRMYAPSRIFCGFLSEGTYVIDPHADVYKCLTFVGQKKHSIGCIDRKGDIEEYTWAYYDWMSRDPLTIRECRECKMLPSCCGGCAAVAYERYGTYHACGCSDPYEEMRQQLQWYLEQKAPQDFKAGKIIWD